MCVREFEVCVCMRVWRDGGGFINICNFIFLRVRGENEVN